MKGCECQVHVTSRVTSPCDITMGAGPMVILVIGHDTGGCGAMAMAGAGETAIICVFESIKNVNKTQSVVLAAAACVWSAS